MLPLIARTRYCFRLVFVMSFGTFASAIMLGNPRLHPDIAIAPMRSLRDV